MFTVLIQNLFILIDIYEKGDELLDILPECEKANNPNLVLIFTSTSKITYPGSGVSCLGASRENIDQIKKIMQMQTIGHDKMNMLRHVKYFGSADGVREYMKGHADILRPKFEVCQKILSQELSVCDNVSWTKPLGGYFVSLNVPEGCAKKVVEMCAGAGVVLTDAGATFPYHIDPKDENIRIAPSFPPVEELEKGLEVLCCCVKLAFLETKLG